MEAQGELLSLIGRARDLRREGHEQEARAVYQEVWQHALTYGDDYAACIAAHMLGVSEPMPLDEKLQWHLVSLERANRLPDGQAATFYASIFSNLGYIYAHSDRSNEAVESYLLARQHTDALNDDAYGQNLRTQIEWALGQLGVESEDVTS